MCTLVTPAVPYLLLGLQDVQWAVGNSRGTRKLARTPHVNQKKKSTRVDTETDLKAACLLYKGLQLDFFLQSLSLYGKNFMACCACFTFHEQVLPFLWFFLVLVVI